MAAATDDAGDSNEMIRVVSSDGEHFEMPEAAANLSLVLRHMIEDDCADAAGIPLAVVAAKPLAKIVDYCTKHAAKSSGLTIEEAEELKRFDAEFIEVDTDMLYDLLRAAHFMDVEGLFKLAVQRTADLIKGKTPEQNRETFGIVNDFTPEEEEEICRENEWAFQY
ncbi:hypothetical protein E2562_032445 [Oryza meyeriana var. granulata]|uniref:SKP1-like protein n=1 Tax=Oryza meyeriana var. granulata TaxID=110450 RepID=A0A6G1E5D5_9ORYZ|nr:hypothetical protein E2562_032445 [Oryza meyeriana var. granulata]